MTEDDDQFEREFDEFRELFTEYRNKGKLNKDRRRRFKYLANKIADKLKDIK